MAPASLVAAAVIYFAVPDPALSQINGRARQENPHDRAMSGFLIRGGFCIRQAHAKNTQEVVKDTRAPSIQRSTSWPFNISTTTLLLKTLTPK